MPDPDPFAPLLKQSTEHLALVCETLAAGIAKTDPPGDDEAERRGARKFQALIVDALNRMAARGQSLADQHS